MWPRAPEGGAEEALLPLEFCKFQQKVFFLSLEWEKPLLTPLKIFCGKIPLCPNPPGRNPSDAHGCDAVHPDGIERSPGRSGWMRHGTRSSGPGWVPWRRASGSGSRPRWWWSPPSSSGAPSRPGCAPSWTGCGGCRRSGPPGLPVGRKEDRISAMGGLPAKDSITRFLFTERLFLHQGFSNGALGPWATEQFSGGHEQRP